MSRVNTYHAKTQDEISYIKNQFTSLLPTHMQGKTAEEWDQLIEQITQEELSVISSTTQSNTTSATGSSLRLPNGSVIFVPDAVGALTIVEDNTLYKGYVIVSDQTGRTFDVVVTTNNMNSMD